MTACTVYHLAEAEFNAWRELRDKKREFEARRGEAALEAAQGDAAARKRYQEAVATIVMLEDVITGARAKREELLRQAVEAEARRLEEKAEALEREADAIERRRLQVEAELRKVEGSGIRILPAQALSRQKREEAERLRLAAKRKRAEGPLANGYAEGCSLEELVEAMLRYPALVPSLSEVETWWREISRAAAGHGGPIEAARLVWRNGRIHHDCSFALTHSSLVKLERTWDGGTMTRGERTNRTLAQIPLPVWIAGHQGPVLPPPPTRRLPSVYRIEASARCTQCGSDVSVVYMPTDKEGPGLCEACYERLKVPEPRMI
jgi:hypothetical protein